MKQRGDFIILDNGAEDGMLVHPRQLLSLASQVGADEVVVPDTLGDKQETISQALGFTTYAHPAFKYMVVLQGKSADEILSMVGFIDANPSLQYVTTIGIPKHLCKINKHFRVTLTEWLMKEEFDSRYEVHYLGAWRRYMSEIVELQHITRGRENFRGIDTAIPISMGLEDLDVFLDIQDSKPSDFWDVTADTAQAELNVGLYLAAAGYRFIL